VGSNLSPEVLHDMSMNERARLSKSTVSLSLVFWMTPKSECVLYLGCLDIPSLLDPSVSGPFSLLKCLDKPRKLQISELLKELLLLYPKYASFANEHAILLLPAVQGLNSILFSFRPKESDQCKELHTQVTRV
jgi:hypothetical protein